MSSKNLSIAGPDSSSYELGQPISAHEGDRHLGSMTMVAPSKDGGTLQLGGFVPTGVPQTRALRMLVVLEITAFIADRFPGVQTIGYTLNHRIDGRRDGLAVANVRATLLRSMGGDQIRITPNRGSQDDGHFAVQGVWRRSPRALEALAAALEKARETHRREQSARGGAPLKKLRAWVDRLF